MIINIFFCHRRTSPIIAQVYIFYITTPGVLMQVMFQGTNNDVSPMFEKYKVIISIFIVVITIHVGAIILGENFQIWIGIRIGMGLMGSLVSFLVSLPLSGYY